MKKNLLSLILWVPIMVSAQSVFINEIHYDNDGTDTGEAIEIAGPAGTDLNGWTLVLYNGSNGTVYDTDVLNSILADAGNGFGFLTISYPENGVQNGGPDGIALVDASNTVIQFISYEGSFEAVDGPAAGLTSEDIGVAESSSTPIGFSLQLTGDGTVYTDFAWATEQESTFGSANTVQSFVDAAAIVFINEIHYDNDGTDINEAIEIAGTAGTSLEGWTLVLYNGNGGAVYDTEVLSGTLADAGEGYGFFTVSFPSNGIQNGAPDGIALVDASNTVVQFLSYEGNFEAVDGPAAGLTSEDIGISEPSSALDSESLQLTGTGLIFSDFTWTLTTSTFDAVNDGQSFGAGTPDPDPDPDPVSGVAFINEIHYDNTGTDADEGIEIAGPAGLDLNGWSIVLYNGNGGTEYFTEALAGIVPDQDNGFGTVFFPILGVQNGSPDGIALVDSSNTLIQFLSYEGSFTAVGGVADGVLSEDIGVEEASSSALGLSLQLEGTGSSYEDFTWAASATATYDAVNNNQFFSTPISIAFINEIHYDNDGTDTGEAIEIAGTAGLDLTGWNLTLYNGNGGTAYDTEALSGIIPDQDNGYGTLFFEIAGIQNGAPDGVVLSNSSDEIVQFLSYEGSFTATDGIANGLTSTDILVSEESSTTVGFSLQLEGTGQSYDDFAWTSAQANTFGAVNTGQSFGGTIPPPPASIDTVTVAEARLLPLGSEVYVQAVITAADQFGGPAYLQDSTAGIALFDSQVHGGDFQIGDEIIVLASISEFFSQVQLASVQSVTLLDTGVVVTPALVTLSELGSYEGQLVTIQDLSFDIPAGVLFPSSNYDVSDATGTEQLRIDNDVDLVGRNRPEGPTTATGVVGRFDTFLQFLPRFQPDLPGTTEYVPGGGSDIPFDETFDVATWNMEFFGTTVSGYGPSDVALQASNAATVLMALNADIIAIQEVSEDSVLQDIVSLMPDYAVVCSDVYSYSFEEPDPNDPFPAQKLCYVYNTATVNVIKERALFEELYTDARLGNITDLDDYPTGSASSFWSSGRLPYQLIADVTIAGNTEQFNLINVHAKSGSASDDLARRVYDITVLKDTFDVMFPNDNIILLGDYNDDVTESIGGGVTTYDVILSDTASFDAVTEILTENDIPTFVGGTSSTIDHVAISNELFDDYIDGSASIYFPFNDIADYTNTTSDHIPVLTRFDITPDVICVKPIIKRAKVWPNPFGRYVNLYIESTSNTDLNLSIIGFRSGNEVLNQSISVASGSNKVGLNLNHLRKGFYVLKIRNEETGATEKTLKLFKF